jgi:hypothetical protein
MQRILKLSTLLILLAGCRKVVQPPAGSSDDALVSFVCTSTQLINDMGAGNTYLLIDTSRVAGFTKTSQYMYPTTEFNQSLSVPWIYYMHLHPGTHTFTLLDTGLTSRVTDHPALSANAPTSIFYTDSLGYFRSLILPDQYNTRDSTVNIRFINLSPDTGPVFFTIDEKPASQQGFNAAYAYGQNSAFVDYPNPATDSLRINFYQSGDSVDVIARLFLLVDPGHAYTFALQGYINPSPGYPDPLTGNWEAPLGGVSVLVYKNH